jgi:hypothetical protein
MNRQKIHKLAVEYSKNLLEAPHYFANYNRACREVEEKFTDDQREKYKAMAKEWTEIELPPNMQQR